MSDETSAELEREAEAARARMAGTAETIRRKLTAGQLIDEVADYFTGGDLAGAARNLGTQVRDNPLPLALMGAGVAWLAFGQGVSGQHRSSHTPGRPGSHSYNTTGAPLAEGHRASHSASHSGLSSVSESVGDAMSGAGDTLSRGAHGAAEAVSGAASSVSDTAGAMADSLSRTADRLRHSMLTGTSRGMDDLRHRAGSITEQEPLVIAALGMALGAVVGAMLPATDLEKEQIGPYAEKMRRNATDMADRASESAGRVAEKAYGALKREADRQGLSPHGAPLGERIGEVVKATAHATEDAVRDAAEGNDADHNRA